MLPWLAVALIANLALASEGILYLGLLSAQLVCYGLALIGWLLDRAGKQVRLFYFPYYFVYIHLAAFVAVLQATLGRRGATWTPTVRG